MTSACPALETCVESAIQLAANSVYMKAQYPFLLNGKGYLVDVGCHAALSLFSIVQGVAYTVLIRRTTKQQAEEAIPLKNLAVLDIRMDRLVKPKNRKVIISGIIAGANISLLAAVSFGLNKIHLTLDKVLINKAQALLNSSICLPNLGFNATRQYFIDNMSEAINLALNNTNNREYFPNKVSHAGFLKITFAALGILFASSCLWDLHNAGKSNNKYILLTTLNTITSLAIAALGIYQLSIAKDFTIFENDVTMGWEICQG